MLANLHRGFTRQATHRKDFKHPARGGRSRTCRGWRRRRSRPRHPPAPRRQRHRGIGRSGTRSIATPHPATAWLDAAGAATSISSAALLGEYRGERRSPGPCCHRLRSAPPAVHAGERSHRRRRCALSSVRSARRRRARRPARRGAAGRGRPSARGSKCSCGIPRLPRTRPARRWRSWHCRPGMGERDGECGNARLARARFAIEVWRRPKSGVMPGASQPKAGCVRSALAMRLTRIFPLRICAFAIEDAGLWRHIHRGRCSGRDGHR